VGHIIEQVVGLVGETLRDNEFFSGGFVLLLVGALVALLRNAPGRIWSAVLRRLTVSIEITAREDAFLWLQVWLAKQGYTRRARRWLVVGRHGSSSEFAERVDGGGGDAMLVPAPGQHLFRYGRGWIWMTYVREPMRMESGLLIGYDERIELRLFGQDQSAVELLLHEARELAMPSKPNVTHIRVALWGDWRMLRSQKARSLSSLVFDDGLSEDLLEDILRFRESASWYRSLGIPYHRGYLLSGPPGNGKSSLVVALAGELGMDLCIVPLDTRMSDDRFRGLLLDAPDDSLLLEDIDKVPLCTDDSRRGDEEVLTLSAVLNALDGIVVREGQIVFMTANDTSRVHPALLRPGRADVHLRLGNASVGQACCMFERFYGSDGYAEQFGRSVGGKGISMAALQEHLMRYRDDPWGALTNVEHLLVGCS